jgi:hypothetical protein
MKTDEAESLEKLTLDRVEIIRAGGEVTINTPRVMIGKIDVSEVYARGIKHGISIGEDNIKQRITNTVFNNLTPEQKSKL